MGQTIIMLFRKRNQPAVRQRLYRRLQVEQLENRIVPSIALQSEYTGITYASSGYVPPDTQGAAGTTNYVETTNQEIALFSPKNTGASQVSDSFSDFWLTRGKLSRPDSTSILADPVVVWDEQIQRFIVGDDDIDTGTTSGTPVSAFDIAVSKSASPATLTSADWNFFQVSTTETGYSADYPGNLGWNHDAFVFTLNMTPDGNPTYHVQVNSIDSNALVNGTPLKEGVNAFQNDFLPDPGNNFTASNLRPTVMHDSKAGDPMWLVEEGNNAASIDVVKMSNVLSGSASFNTTTLAVNSYNPAVPEKQPDGTRITADTDSRIQKAAMQNGLLVAAHTVSDAAANLDEIQWYAINTTSGTPVLQQQGDISGGAGTYYAYPGIDINPQGDIGVSYMASGTAAGQYMSTYFTGRTPLDPAGTMEAPVLVQAGQANYHDYSSGRAGDLSGISVDSDGSFWIANEYANAEPTDNWSTAIAHFTVSTNVTTTANNASAVYSPNAQTVTLSAAVADSSDPSISVSEGAVTFTVKKGSTIIGMPVQGTVSGGKASADFSLPAGQAVGNYTIAVSYSDSSGNFSDGGDTNGTLAIAPANVTTTANNASAAYSPTVQSVTLSAAVADASISTDTVDEGAVTFTIENGSTIVGTPVQGTVSGGKASADFSLPAGQAAGSYTIAVSYSDGQGNFTDNGDRSATLTVLLAPTVTTNPANVTVTAGQTATFTAAANGNPTPTVRWQVSNDIGKTWTDISGASSTTLTLSNVPSSLDGNEYRAVFNNSLGSAATNAATLTVQTVPVVTTNPANVTVTAGQTATFTAAARGNPKPTVQWQVSGDGGKTWIDISGASATTLTLGNVLSSLDGDEYRAVFSNSAGSATTSAALLTVQTPPAITSVNTVAFIVGLGGSFTVTAAGSPTPTVTESGALPGGVTFADNRNGTATLGGTPAAGTQGTYHFTLTAHNGVGSDVTQNFTLTVNAAPVPASPASSPPAPVSAHQPPALNVPPLLALFDALLGGIETVNANNTEAVTDSLFGMTVLVSTYDGSGNFVGATLFGVPMPNWIWFL